MNYLGLAPPLIESGRVEDFTKAGQTLSVSLSPHDTSLCVFVSPTLRLTVSYNIEGH